MVYYAEHYQNKRNRLQPIQSYTDILTMSIFAVLVLDKMLLLMNDNRHTYLQREKRDTSYK